MVNEFSSGDINLLMSLINAGLLNFYVHNNGFQLGIENTELEKFI